MHGEKRTSLRRVSGDETERIQRDWERNSTIIDGEEMHPCVAGANHATLDGFTIQKGNTDESGWLVVVGAGMNNGGSSPTVRNCVFTGNRGTLGGGMHNSNHASPTLINCTFAENSARDFGGGVFNISFSSPTIRNCTFVRNTAGDFGGGLYNELFSSPMVSDCTFIKNTAGRYGGGLSNFNTCSPTLINCTFAEGTANWGGGICNIADSFPTLTNCVLTKNMAERSGGAIFNSAGSSTLLNCTFMGNTAKHFCGGIHNYTDSCRPILTNCILWDEGGEILGGAPTVNYSCIRDDSKYEGTKNIHADPNFAPDGCQLLSSSPCIDRGDPTTILTHDILGVARPQGTGYDMGAYEYKKSPEEKEEPYIIGAGLFEIGSRIELRVIFPDATGSVIYEWFKDGLVLPIDAPVYSIGAAHKGHSGVYSCVVIDESEKGIYVTAPVSVTVAEKVPTSNLLNVILISLILVSVGAHVLRCR